jgi:hypothetical protein
MCRFERKRGVSVLGAEVLEFVAEVADDVLERDDHFVPARDFLLQPRHARIPFKFIRHRSELTPPRDGTVGE